VAGARRRVEESIRLYDRVYADYYLPVAKAMLGRVEQLEGDTSGARARYLASIAEIREKKFTLHLIWAVELLADLMINEGEAELGITLVGAVDRQREAIGGGPDRRIIGLGNHRETAARVLDEKTIGRAWTRGRSMTLDEAMEYALREM
jgi:hypothetical protein